MSLIKSATAYYIDAKGTREQTDVIQLLGFVWVMDAILPQDAERVFQTHEE